MWQSITSVSVADLNKVLAEPSTHVVDVRETNEFAAGHIPGAASIPMSTIPLRVSELPADKDVYIICQSGGRSMQVCAWLANNGIRAINVQGGTGTWAASGLPVVRGM